MNKIDWQNQKCFYVAFNLFQKVWHLWRTLLWKYVTDLVKFVLDVVAILILIRWHGMVVGINPKFTTFGILVGT